MFLVEGSAPATELNEAALSQLKTLAAKAKKAFPKGEELRIADVLRWPGVVSSPAADERELRPIAEKLCRKALEEFVAARSREGAKLAAAIAERIAAMRARVEAIAPLMPQSVAAYKEKLRRGFERRSIPRTTKRVRAEVTVFAQKADRRRGTDAPARAPRRGGAGPQGGGTRSSPVGKRLDFLAQELNREANTVRLQIGQPGDQRGRPGAEAARRADARTGAEPRMSGKLFVITAPSGAGKTSLIDAIMHDDPTLKVSVSYTTRAPRKGEQHGVDYHFVDDRGFLAMKQRGEFLESAEVHGYRYGTSKKVITDALARGEDLILEIDWQGARQVRGIYPQCVRHLHPAALGRGARAAHALPRAGRRRRHPPPGGGRARGINPCRRVQIRYN
jgi:hypothetical protein